MSAKSVKFPLTRILVLALSASFMRAALAIQVLTRAIASIVIVPRNRRMSWQVKDYSIAGEQEEPISA